MKWTFVQRGSAALLLVLMIVGAHVALPSAAASKALLLALLLAAAVHTSASLYVVLTDYRPFAAHNSAVAAAVTVLGAAAAIYGGTVILTSGAAKPVLGHLPASECRSCHVADEHVRWPLALHEKSAERPGVDCEGCHSVTASSPGLLARWDAQTKQHVPVEQAISLCLDCHGPTSIPSPAWPGTIHQDVKCGTCHSRIETAGEPSWKRACRKCHPRADDVHGDVGSLDTTFVSPSSQNDLHQLKCRSCHASSQ